ncbi:FecR family protein [Wenyingzhuangia sp. IMCC45533]
MMKSEKEILAWLDGTSTSNDEKNIDNNELKKIAHYTSHIKTPNIDIDLEWKKFDNLKKQQIKPKEILSIRFFMKFAAAILLFVIPTVTYVYFFQQTTIVSNSTINTAYQLPDDSKVYLNRNSEIAYSKFNWKNNREIQLKGEAFFEVEKGKKFSVTSSSGKVTVLGTKFNIKDHKTYFEVKCFKGLVRVETRSKTVQLSKGQRFEINHSRVKTFEHGTMPLWLQNESVFEQTKLIHVLNKLEQEYQVTIKLNHINPNTLFTGAIPHNNLDIALKAITVPLNIRFKMNNNIIILYP